MNPKFNGLLQISYVYVIERYKSYGQHAYVKTHEPFQTTTPKIMKIPTLAKFKISTFIGRLMQDFQLIWMGSKGKRVLLQLRIDV